MLTNLNAALVYLINYFHYLIIIIMKCTIIISTCKIHEVSFFVK
jgi:hypothetical protein